MVLGTNIKYGTHGKVDVYHNKVKGNSEGAFLFFDIFAFTRFLRKSQVWKSHFFCCVSAKNKFRCEWQQKQYFIIYRRACGFQNMVRTSLYGRSNQLSHVLIPTGAGAPDLDRFLQQQRWLKLDSSIKEISQRYKKSSFRNYFNQSYTNSNLRSTFGMIYVSSSRNYCTLCFPEFCDVWRRRRKIQEYSL